jgi:hypothetical protein
MRFNQNMQPVQVGSMGAPVNAPMSPMQMSPQVAAAQRADAMGQLKGAIGVPGGTPGGTMQNARLALQGYAKGGAIEGKTNGKMIKMAAGGMSEKDMKENEEYRKKPEYYGYEDYTPSGRAAIRHYNDVNSDNPKDYVKQKYSIPYDPVAAKKAQAVQREVMNEGRRETRGTVPAAALKKGGNVKESKEMVGKEVAFMKNKGAPKSMLKHEEAEMGEKKPKYMAFKGNGQPDGMKPVQGYAKGGGIESKGKTKGKMVKMAAGGMVGSASARADGCAQRGKTRGKQVKMAGGGSC